MKEKIFLPSNPPSTYKEEWKGWDDFFGREPIKKWNNESILTFLRAIENELEFLEPLEIFTIIDQSGSSNLIQSNKNFKSILQTTSYSKERKGAIKNLKKDFGDSSEENNDDQETEILTKFFSTTEEQVEEENQFFVSQLSNPKKAAEDFFRNRHIQELKAYDKEEITLTLDHEAIEFFLKYRIDKFWNILMSGDYDIDILIKEEGGKYFTIIKSRFLDEYEKVISLQIPSDYQFKDNDGNLAQPNLMQRLVAHRLKEHKKYGNWSSMGSGKTLSAVLAGRVAELKNTLIITFNSNVNDWDNTIKNAFPENSKVFSKEKDYIPILNDNVYNYIIFNYESFQGSDFTDSIVAAITANKIDYIVLDEVQLVKQREEDKSSNRKKIIDSLIKNIDSKNFKNGIETHMLFMSAVPVINNLREPKKILEMLKGVKYDEIRVFPIINYALSIHKQLFINGVRFKPKYDIEVNTNFIKIDGNHLISAYLDIPKGNVLNIEQLFIPDKLQSIKNLLKKGTMIYTHYVTDIIDQIKKFVESCGFTISIYTGRNKEGLECFKQKKCDILICSSPVGTGVDGLQRICDRLIVLSLPWTNSEYENLVGRIARQGSAFKSVEVIIPQVEIMYNENSYSWDVDRMNRIHNKRTLANVAIDGIIPKELMPTPAEMLRQSKDKLRKWINRIEEEGLVQLTREKMIMCVDDGLIEIEQKHVEFKQTKLELEVEEIDVITESIEKSEDIVDNEIVFKEF